MTRTNIQKLCGKSTTANTGRIRLHNSIHSGHRLGWDAQTRARSTNGAVGRCHIWICSCNMNDAMMQSTTHTDAHRHTQTHTDTHTHTPKSMSRSAALAPSTSTRLVPSFNARLTTGIVSRTEGRIVSAAALEQMHSRTQTQRLVQGKLGVDVDRQGWKAVDSDKK